VKKPVTRIVLQGRGYRIHTGVMHRELFDQLEAVSERTDDGSVDIWEYIDHNIVHRVDPEHFQIVLDDAVVATDLNELIKNSQTNLVRLEIGILPPPNDSAHPVLNAYFDD
jgi:hypothetical protein